jgi:hypothetical protein
MESGQHHPPLQIDYLGRWTAKRFRAGISSDVDDPAILNGNRFSPASYGIHGVDCAVKENQISGLTGTHRRSGE